MHENKLTSYALSKCKILLTQRHFREYEGSHRLGNILATHVLDKKLKCIGLDS